MGMRRMLNSESAMKTVPSDMVWPVRPATQNTPAVTMPGDAVQKLRSIRTQVDAHSMCGLRSV